MSEGYVITAKHLTPAQLLDVEARAILRLKRMRAVTENVGHITLATAALTIEIIEEVQKGNTTMVFIVAVEDLRSIIRSYLSRHKLTAFPYRNGQLLDYISYANFANIAACIG